MNTMELAAENAMRLKAIHIGGLLAREASTSGALSHVGHYIPIWIDPSFPPFPDGPMPLTREEEEVKAWLASHKPVALAGLRRKERIAMARAFPVLAPMAREAQEREGAEARQSTYQDSLKVAHGAPGGPRRTWLDKLVGERT